LRNRRTNHFDHRLNRPVKRRVFVEGAAAIALLAVGGGLWRANHEGVFSVGEGPAYEPWTNWRVDANQGPFALVRAAILAANPHNTQPWLFGVTESRIEVYADTNRNLGAFDPYLREMHIGLGCAVENMALAAAAYGYASKVTLHDGTLEAIPEKPQRKLVATLDLSPGSRRRDELYDAIPRRHTNRAAYAIGRPVAPEVLGALRRLADDEPTLKLFLFTSAEERREFGAAVLTATETIIADKPMIDASQRWFRQSWTEVQKFRDGPTLDTAGLGPLVTAAAKMLPPLSVETNHRYWLQATRDVQIPSTPVFGLIAVRALYDRAQAMRAGRAWQRMHLFATARGLAMQPINQPVELVDRERQLSKQRDAEMILEKLTADPAWKPTFAFRMGLPQRQAPASPRRPVKDVMVAAAI
jgi:nitroreductase